MAPATPQLPRRAISDRALPSHQYLPCASGLSFYFHPSTRRALLTSRWHFLWDRGGPSLTWCPDRPAERSTGLLHPLHTGFGRSQIPYQAAPVPKLTASCMIPQLSDVLLLWWTHFQLKPAVPHALCLMSAYMQRLYKLVWSREAQMKAKAWFCLERKEKGEEIINLCLSHPSRNHHAGSVITKSSKVAKCISHQ